MWVTYVVLRFLPWICTAVDVIRNHLWVLENRGFRRKTAQLMQLMIFISAITGIPACPAFKSPWEIIHQYCFHLENIFTSKAEYFWDSVHNLILIRHVEIDCYREKRIWGWEGGRFIFELQLCLFAVVCFQIGYLTSLTLEFLIWKTGQLFPSHSIMKLDIEKHLVK